MQLKPITAIIVLLLMVASLSIAGCTSSTSPTATPTVEASRAATATPTVTASPSVAATATPTVTGSPSTSSLSASEFNARYAKVNPDYKIATPFTKTTNTRGHAVYSGIVKSEYSSDNSKMSVELCSSQSDAQETLQQILASAKQQGYSDFVDPFGNGTLWGGYKPIPNTSDEVYTFIAGINEPTNPFSAEMGVGYNVETMEGTAPP